MDIKDYTPLSFGAHPEYRRGDKFILLYPIYDKMPGEILWLDNNYNTNQAYFRDNKDILLTTFWSKVAPYRDEEEDLMEDSHFARLCDDIIAYRDLMNTKEKMEEFMTACYGFNDGEGYARAKLVAEDIAERAERLKRHIRREYHVKD